MNKVLLKRLLFELLEEIVRLESQLQSLESAAQAGVLPYLKALASALEMAKNQLMQHQEDFVSLYLDTPIDEEVGGELFDGPITRTRREMNRLSKGLYRLKRGQILPETELFLSSLNLDKLLPDAPRLVILPAQDHRDRDPLLDTESMLLEYLPVLSEETPLRWVGLLESFSRLFCRETVLLTSLMENLKLPEPKEAILAPLLNLRILGPCYYPYYVLNAFERLDAMALWVVEPILFQELNRFGLVNKDLVILHQGIERARQHRSLDEPKELTRILGNNDELWDNILKDVEKAIPERLAFTEKLFIRSQIIEDRLSNGVLIGAIPMLSSPAQLRDDLKNLDEENTIYSILQQLQESPASPREIINTGWLHKLDCSFGWLQTFLSMDPKSGWEFIRQTVLELDANMLKSIETSEVHRVLSYEEAEPLVSA